MPAHLVFHNRVHDAEAMHEQYIPQAMETLGAYGGEVLALAENSDVIEGNTDLPRTILVKFASRDKAEAWYKSAEYQAVLPIRLGATEGFTVLVDGFE